MKAEKKGFTLIELMLAMAFLGTMLVGIAALMMRITSIYQKGLSIRAINTNGREIISDLTRTITSSPTHLKVNPTYQGNEIKTSDVLAALSQYYLTLEDSDQQYGGVFCTGSFSYVWNTAAAIKESREGSNDHVIKIHLAGGNDYIPKLARFADADRFACAVSGTGGVNKTIGEGRSLTMDNITELISNDDMDLALYNFRILPAVQNETTKQIFFSGSFILATIRGGVNIKSNGDFCSGDKQEGDEFTLNNFDYCAVNKFNFSARATGEASITNRNGDN
ncbi:prepilin-type N-terminal cleavage/methylation domain-containing protein [Candidatus Saccharibacteria bacterium]|nr:prepilin-type N-terminal cleavage/methylation domain-containing protein [Candidatus Saccharibacteria bacterium]